MTGSNTETEVYELRDQLVSLIHKGGFELGKWACSNSDVVSNDLNESFQLPIGRNSCSVKVLGIYWDTKMNTLFYRNQDFEEPYSKRGILSRIARTYDINGYLSPFTFSMKTFLQELWLAKID